MKMALLSRMTWDDLGTDGINTYLKSGGNVIMTVDRMHIHAEDADESARQFGIDVDDAVVLSRHSSASGKPTLTVHPIGNYHDNHMGGKAEVLVHPMPHMMTGTLRRIKASNDMPEYEVSFEVTHHGPYLSVPAMYIEIGSDETHWGDTHAAGILVDSMLSAEEHDEYPVVTCVGGGHYAPRFTELALTHKVDIGHMLPYYQLKDAPDEDIMRMVDSAAKSTGSKMFYVHRKSLNGSEERRVNGIIDSLGYERLVSKDFEPSV